MEKIEHYLDIKPYSFSELPDTANPKSVMFWRKTKAGRWEHIETRWYRQGYKNADIMRICMIYKCEEACSLFKKHFTEPFNSTDEYKSVYNSLPYKVAYKATTVKGQQIFSTEYEAFIDKLLRFNLSTINTLEKAKNAGIMVDKKEFVPVNRILKWMQKLAQEHKGIKNWKQSKPCKEDNFLCWGKLICNDGYVVSVAFIGFVE